jgi:TolB-like protein
VPDELQRIVSKLLEKDPALRYQSAADLVSDLKRLALTLEGRVAAPVQKTRKNKSLVAAIVFVLIVLAIGHIAKLLLLPDTKAPPTKALALGKKMLAVLPLRNLGSPEDEYFADGITEEILTSLAGFPVLASSLAQAPCSTRTPTRAFVKSEAELGVEYVLEGTIQWDKSVSPPRVRLHEQLIRVSDDVHLWGQRYDAVINDIFEVQSAVAEKVVEALDVFLGERERQALRAAPTDNPEAYDYFLRGIDYGSKNFEEETLA